MNTESESAQNPQIAGQALLNATGVTKRFGGLIALDHVDLEIDRGELVGLIGPNGAGKTTLVNCLTGVERPTSGHIYFDGAETTRIATHEIGKRGLARTFQIVRPFRSMTVRQNVAVGALFGSGLKRRSMRDAMQKADETLRRTHLWQERDRPAAALLVAQAKRLELARALAMDPHLLVLDEVMAGLNPTEMDSAVALIREIASGGTTVLVIEHVMKAIIALANRIVVLQERRKLADGPPEIVLRQPAVIGAYLGERYARRLLDVETASEMMAYE